jgi:hypothetical protein
VRRLVKDGAVQRGNQLAGETITHTTRCSTIGLVQFKRTVWK